MTRKSLVLWVLVGIAAVALHGFAPDTAAQDDTLSQTYDDPGGVITLNYPEGWIADKYFGIIFIANSQAALEGELDTVEPGELQINLMAGASYEVGLPESGTALEAAEMLLAEAATDPGVVSTTGPDALEGFQYDAAKLTATQGTVDVLAIIIIADDQHTAMLLAGAPQGEMVQYEETILAIAKSIQFVDGGGAAVEESAETTAGVPVGNAVNWQTETVSLTADNFYITAGGQIFTAAVDGVDVSGDPGDEAYTTLEVTWQEYGVPMRLYMYFESDGTIWQAFEMRTYDGSPDGEWITYEGDTFTTPLGQAYQVMSFSRQYNDDGLYFENLQLQAFTSGEAAGADTAVENAGEVAEAITLPTTIAGPEECRNVAVSIQDYSSEYNDLYGPLNLLDNNAETGWSSSGYDSTEYVTVGLRGVQTVYGVLLNSYSPSVGYDKDSIQDFEIRITTADGEQKIVYTGQAAFQQGYQSYVFEPVETDHLQFMFLSTYGGGYFEAADIMICAADSSLTPVFVSGQEIRQWASSAIATSQYTDTNWSAMQATGAPDAPNCGDYGAAWASSTVNGIDELVVYFDTPVFPTQVNIYQNYNPGAISSITLLLAGGSDGPPVPFSADPGTSCPGVFTVNIPVELQGQLIEGVAILVDQSNHTGWNEIDAVELVGYTP
ncbi:MAG: discoidin domain-containing protein [Anaerolineae bacterium]|nr:discoidin domain-containing protein [Anaerolineae bacterium]